MFSLFLAYAPSLHSWGWAVNRSERHAHHKAKSLMPSLCPTWQPLLPELPRSIQHLHLYPAYPLILILAHMWSYPGGNRVVVRTQNQTRNHLMPKGANCRIREKRCNLQLIRLYCRNDVRLLRKVQTASSRRSEDRGRLLLFSVFDSPPSSGQMVTFHTPSFQEV